MTGTGQELQAVHRKRDHLVKRTWLKLGPDIRHLVQDTQFRFFLLSGGTE